MSHCCSYYEDFDEPFNLLQQVINRVKYLTLDYKERPLSTLFMKPIGPAPLLHSLSLVCDCYRDAVPTFPEDTLFYQIGQLCNLELLRVPIPWSAPLFKGLVTLKISHTEPGNMHKFVAAMTACPCMEYLEMEYCTNRINSSVTRHKQA